MTRLPTAALTTSAHDGKELRCVPCGAVAAALKQTARSQRQGIGSSSDACRSGIASTDSDGADEPAMCAIAATVSAAQKEQEEEDGQRGGAARRRCVLLRLALALWRGQLYRFADACAR